MTLAEYLKEKKIDEIENDDTFCEEEYNAIGDYFSSYQVTDEDIKELEARGYQEDSFVDDEWMKIEIDGEKVEFRIREYHDYIEAILFNGSFTIKFPTDKYTLEDVTEDIKKNYKQYRVEDFDAAYRAYYD